MILVYDETFEGLISTFFEIYEQKISNPIIKKNSKFEPVLFEDVIQVSTDSSKSERLLNALKKRSGRQFYQFFFAAHNDRDDIENDLYEYVRYIFSDEKKRSRDYSHPAVLKIAQYAKSVNREKHRMEAFVRFRLTKDNIFFATIEPDFDVIPLILKHFRERYGDQKWIIYDLKRDYGIHFDLDKILPVNFSFENSDKSLLNTDVEFFSDAELQFQDLWADYFKSTNIESRKNMKLHLQHVPRRYWKYLSEKTIPEKKRGSIN